MGSKPHKPKMEDALSVLVTVGLAQSSRARAGNSVVSAPAAQCRAQLQQGPGPRLPPGPAGGQNPRLSARRLCTGSGVCPPLTPGLLPPQDWVPGGKYSPLPKGDGYVLELKSPTPACGSQSLGCTSSVGWRPSKREMGASGASWTRGFWDGPTQPLVPLTPAESSSPTPGWADQPSQVPVRPPPTSTPPLARRVQP